MLTVPDEIKELLHLDSCPKNIRIHFPNGERSDVCNDLIVKDSVKFTESLCSQDKLKFGLCESPVFECETVGVGNIKGATIEVSCEVYCNPTVTGAEFKTDIQAFVYAISYGTFVVDSCKRQADMIHRRIVAYGGTATFYHGISNSFEISKDYYFPAAYSSIVYDANTFLLAISNIGVKQYSPSVFNATEVSPSGDSTYAFGIKEWQYEGNNVGLNFTGRYFSYGSNFATRDVLCQIEGNIREDVINQIVDDIISMCDGYGLPAEMKDPQYWKKDKLLLIMMGYGAGGATLYKNASYTSLPYLFYPFLEEGNGFIRVFYGVSKIQFKYVGGALIDEVTYSDPYIENLTALKLTSKYPELNNYTTHFENREIPEWQYRRQFVPPEDYDNVKELNKIIELSGLFGFARRNNSFDLLNIKRQFGLLPDDTLYPGLTLYPTGVVGGSIKREDYQSCWYDDEYTKPFGAIRCTYKDSNNDEYTYIYYMVGSDQYQDVDSYQTYDFSDNEIIQNNTWTAANIKTICQRIAANISGVTYMPVDFVGRGLPYVEAGDTFEILTRSNDSITTIVLNKTTSGEQTLTDSYKSV